MIVRFKLEGVLKAFVTMFDIAVGKVGVAEKHMVFEFFVVDGDGTGEVGDGFVNAVDLEVDSCAVVVEVGILGVFLDFDVKYFEDVFVGHIVGGRVVVLAARYGHD